VRRRRIGSEEEEERAKQSLALVLTGELNWLAAAAAVRERVGGS
jgi:hypothetical protein